MHLQLAWGPLYTQDWEPVTNALQALSLVEKAEPVQVRFTLRWRDQRSTWMQNGCKVYMDSYMTSNGSCFMVTWTITWKLPHGGRPHTTPGEPRSPNAHKCWLIILIYHVWGPAWIEIHGNIIRLRARSHMTSHCAWGSLTRLHDFGGELGRPLDSHNFMVTALGSCMKWPAVSRERADANLGRMEWTSGSFDLMSIREGLEIIGSFRLAL